MQEESKVKQRNQERPGIGGKTAQSKKQKPRWGEQKREGFKEVDAVKQATVKGVYRRNGIVARVGRSSQ